MGPQGASLAGVAARTVALSVVTTLVVHVWSGRDPFWSSWTLVTAGCAVAPALVERRLRLAGARGPSCFLHPLAASVGALCAGWLAFFVATAKLDASPFPPDAPLDPVEWPRWRAVVPSAVFLVFATLAPAAVLATHAAARTRSRGLRATAIATLLAPAIGLGVLAMGCLVLTYAVTFVAIEAALLAAVHPIAAISGDLVERALCERRESNPHGLSPTGS